MNIPDIQVGHIEGLCEVPSLAAILDRYEKAVVPLMRENKQAIPGTFSTPTSGLALESARMGGDVPSGTSDVAIQGDWIRATQPMVPDLLDAVSAILGVSMEFRQRNFGFEGAGIKWHTNSDAPGRRIYLVWNEMDRSKTLFHPPGLNEDVDPTKMAYIEEQPGWEAHTFNIPEPPTLFWHAIRPMGIRLSIGFNVEPC